MRYGLLATICLGITLLAEDEAPCSKSKGGVEKAVDATVDATKTASQKTAGKTKTAAMKTADATKDAAIKTADVSKDAAVKTKKAFKPTPPEMIVDINSANQYQLKSLPGIGDAQVSKIIAGRPYKNKSDLVRKNVLPEAAYNRIKDTIVAR